MTTYTTKERMNWTEQCEAMEQAHPALHDFLETWGKHCGAPRTVFRGHLCKLLRALTAARAEVAPPRRYSIHAHASAGGQDCWEQSETDANGEWVLWEDIASQYMNSHQGEK